MRTLSLFILFLGFVFLFPKSYASNINDDFNVSPRQFYNLEMNKGESRKLTINISNHMYIKIMQNYSFEFIEFNVKDNDLSPTIPDEMFRNSLSLSNYITFPKEKITIQPKTRRKIDVTVTVPKDYKHGSMLGALLFSEDVSDAKKKTGMGFGASKRILIPIVVSIKDQGSSLIKTDLVQKENDLTIDLKNNGDKFVNPIFKVFVMEDNRRMGVFDLTVRDNKKSIPLFPEHKIKSSFKIPDSMWKNLKKPSVLIVGTDASKKFSTSQKFELKPSLKKKGK